MRCGGLGAFHTESIFEYTQPISRAFCALRWPSGFTMSEIGLPNAT